MGKLAAWGPRLETPPHRVPDIGDGVWKDNLHHHVRGIKVVGTPIGTTEFIAEHGRHVVREGAQLLEQLLKLASLQASWLILYFCAGPRVNYLLRTLPPSKAQGVAEAHDVAIMEAFGGLHSISGSDGWDYQLHGVSHSAVHKQASLPHRG